MKSSTHAKAAVMDPFDFLREQQDELLSQNQWLREKINPGRRKHDHKAYIQKSFPELGKGMPEKRFLDIGCGPAESLMVVQENGHKAVGIETPVGTGGMGDDYVSYAIRNHILNDLNVVYGPALKVVRRLPEESFDCVNMRGSLEQCFASCMLGRPHHEHHNASLLEWNLETAAMSLFQFGSAVCHLLSAKGRFVIHANGSRNHSEFKPVLVKEFASAGIKGYWMEDALYYGTKA